MTQDNIGKKIAYFCKQARLTQEQLGEKLCISSKTISKWERGISVPDILTMLKLCNILNVNVEELLKDCNINIRK